MLLTSRLSVPARRAELFKIFSGDFAKGDAEQFLIETDWDANAITLCTTLR
jgi:hypothetical protein